MVSKSAHCPGKTFECQGICHKIRKVREFCFMKFILSQPECPNFEIFVGGGGGGGGSARQSQTDRSIQPLSGEVREKSENSIPSGEWKPQTEF